ncbi:MAG: hypothetical protein QMD53_06870 [Actinomycetota bacterium]|nr:hypothetical protein [Actinomycetota bacterium]
MFSSAFIASCAGQDGTVTPPPSPMGGQALVQERCTICHGLGQITQAKKSKEEWQATVEHMVEKGAILSSAEQEEVVQYLSGTYTN